jgi:hypothetical protein
MEPVSENYDKSPKGDKALLPCPFCNDIPSWINEANGDSHYYIKCFTCGIVMKADRRDKVIGIWNTRKRDKLVSLEAKIELIEEMKKVDPSSERFF